MLSELSVRLLRDGYDAVSRLREANGGADWFTARMLGRRALVVRGEEGVRTFYDPDLVTRKGAIPAPVRLLLFGPGAVHGLDGDAHARRKQIHLRIVDRAAVERLAHEVSRRLDEAAAGWPAEDTVRLFDELVRVYGGAVLRWAGTGAHGQEAHRISRDLATIVDGFGIGGSAYPRAWVARIRTTRWARCLVREVRDGVRHPEEGTPLARLAADRELPATVAGVELLNILRPTVAVAYFGAYAAQALDANPAWKDRLARGRATDLRAFEHELRRWYPFTPLLTGRLLREYEWRGNRFRRRSFMALDVLGTNRDPRSWPDADSFRPERFVDREPNAYEYVPQGGGDPATGHRCPGEPLAVGILEVTLRALARLDFELPPEARTVPMRRIPSLPPHGLEIRNVRPSASLGAAPAGA
jgi:fatty-acid peroxygenase